MALVWQEQGQAPDGSPVSYQVWRSGETLRLYANGIQHSEFHPERLLTGSVWDLLWLPALLHRPARYRRVLVLGLGGGSLVPPLRHLLNPESLVAVEKDPLHLAVAREVFEIERFQVECHEDDAVDWLNAYQGPPFDLIIEDLFAPHNDQVSRAVAASRRWLAMLSHHVTDRGMLVMNFGDWAEYRDSQAASRKALSGYSSRFRLSCSDSHNAVVAFSRDPARSMDLRRRLASVPALANRQARRRLNYHIRQLD